MALAKPFTRTLLTKPKNTEDLTTGVNKFIFRRPTFRAGQKMGDQNSTFDRDTTRNIALCSLLPK